MEEETYTRWIFPGAFAAGTFLWLAYVFHIPNLNNLSDAWVKVLVVLLTGMPIIGFLTGNLVRWITNDYTGRGCCKERNIRTLCKKKFKEIPQLFDPLDIDSIDPDVLFSLVAFGVICKNKRMPEYLIKNGRRRWTTCWSAWYSAMGIVFGIFGYLIYCIYYLFSFILRINCEFFNASLNVSFLLFIKFAIAIIFLLLTISFLFYAGCRAWRKACDLELVWFTLAYGPKGEKLSDLLHKKSNDLKSNT